MECGRSEEGAETMEGNAGGGEEEDGRVSPGVGTVGQAEPPAETPETDGPPVLEEADTILEKPKESSRMQKPEERFNMRRGEILPKVLFMW